jgi:hypothetical protein
VTAAQLFTGHTGWHAGVTAAGDCTDDDGRNTVSFGPLDNGLLAIACVWWTTRRGANTIVRPTS